MQATTTVPGKLTLHPAWLAFAAIALAVPVSVLLLRARPRAELPVLSTLPDFTLTDADGKPFGRGDMLGKVWVADFVFTSCADACPRLQNKMRRIQDRLLPEGDIRLLSISVDPERDTPEKLKAYSKTFGATPLWHYLTGQQQAVEKAVVQGFHTAMAKLPIAGEPNAFDIMHGERFVLVDPQGRIRGFYDADDQDKILRDARLLTPGGRG